MRILGDEYHYFGEISQDGKAQGEGTAVMIDEPGTKISGTWFNDEINGLGIEIKEGVSITVSEYDMGVSHGKRTVYYFL